MQRRAWDAAPAGAAGGPHRLGPVPYSTRFAAAELATETTTLYTVPADYVAVVRDLELYGNVASDAEVALEITAPGPLTIIWFVVNPLVPGAWDHWEGRVVLNAGDELVAVTTVNGVHVTVSGYLLSAP